tara:strand:+ start:1155 stop:2078 length:924 start_codon:yes stop_codon:yes gene_type:complete
MAFKMKGFNPGDGTKMGSAFTKRPDKTSRKRREIEKAMYKEDDAPNVPTRYSKEQQEAGAGSSREFFRKEGGDTKTGTKYSIGKTYQKMDGTTRTKKMGPEKGTAKAVTAVLAEDYTKTDRKGKVKKTRYKDTARKSITGKKRTIDIDSYGNRNIKQERASKQAEKEGKDPSLAANPYKDVGDARFTGEGSGKKTHKSGARRATLTTRGKHKGRVEEKERRKSGIGYRKTGRSYIDEGYIESQKQAKADKAADKQKKKDDRAQAKSDKPTWKEKRADVKEQHRQKDLAEQEAIRQKIQERKERKGKA